MSKKRFIALSVVSALIITSVAIAISIGRKNAPHTIPKNDNDHEFDYLVEEDGVILKKTGSREVTEFKIDQLTTMRFIKVNPGEFLMGSPLSEQGRHSDEVQRKVTISKGYYLGMYEVTQREYAAIMGTNPSGFQMTGTDAFAVQNLDTSNFPVEHVTWHDAMSFCNKMSERFGRKFTLPTEAQWEMACRASSNTAFSHGSILNGDYANCSGKPYGINEYGVRLKRTTAVGSYYANKFGFYDMHGNVEEWCLDAMSDDQNSKKVCKSGGYGGDTTMCRSAARYGSDASTSIQYLGFRVCIID